MTSDQLQLYIRGTLSTSGPGPYRSAARAQLQNLKRSTAKCHFLHREKGV